MSACKVPECGAEARHWPEGAIAEGLCEDCGKRLAMLLWAEKRASEGLPRIPGYTEMGPARRARTFGDKPRPFFAGATPRGRR